jgi:tripartite-type tricarboxylate transporter receptor subunit TctC
VFSEYPAAVEQLKAGKLRVLATLSRTRIEPRPDVPTVAESGYDDCQVDVWYGLSVPAKTPKETVSQLASWFATALQVPELKAQLVVQGLYPVGTCGAEFSASWHRHLTSQLSSAMPMFRARPGRQQDSFGPKLGSACLARSV